VIRWEQVVKYREEESKKILEKEEVEEKCRKARLSYLPMYAGAFVGVCNTRRIQPIDFRESVAVHIVAFANRDGYSLASYALSWLQQAQGLLAGTILNLIVG